MIPAYHTKEWWCPHGCHLKHVGRASSPADDSTHVHRAFSAIPTQVFIRGGHQWNSRVQAVARSRRRYIVRPIFLIDDDPKIFVDPFARAFAGYADDAEMLAVFSAE